MDTILSNIFSCSGSIDPSIHRFNTSITCVEHLDRDEKRYCLFDNNQEAMFSIKVPKDKNASCVQDLLNNENTIFAITGPVAFIEYVSQCCDSIGEDHKICIVTSNNRTCKRCITISTGDSG